MHRVIAKHTLIVLGCFFVVLGAIGAVLPLLPTTPFLIAAAWCFAKSSPRFHQWLLNNRWFGNDLRQWEDTRTISRKVKKRATVIIVITFSLSVAMLHDRIELQLMLIAFAAIALTFMWRVEEHEFEPVAINENPDNQDSDYKENKVQQMSQQTPDILKKIIFRKFEEIQQGIETIPMQQMKRLAMAAPDAKGFANAMQAKLDAGQSAVIAEIKKASPSKGILRDPFDPVEIAKSYQANGAACLSVLTDQDFFQGSNDYLKQVRAAVDLPIIRKDFIIDDYQVYEAKAIGADCILLIAAAIGDAQMYELTETALTIGLDVLIEVHNEEEMERALRLPLPMIGINNRDLHSFDVSLDTTIRMLDMIEDDRIVITESGILGSEDVAKMREHQVNSFLVGEAFMRADNPGEKLAELFQ